MYKGTRYNLIEADSWLRECELHFANGLLNLRNEKAHFSNM